MREGPLVSGPQHSLPFHTALLPFLPVTYLSRAARSHYRSVRKAAGRVASPSARVTDCCSALAAEEVRSGKVIGSDGQEVGTEGWRKRWRRAESQGEDDKTQLRDLLVLRKLLKGAQALLLRACLAVVATVVVSGRTRMPGQEEVALMLTSVVVLRTPLSTQSLSEDK